MKIRSLQLKNIGVFEDETIAFPENKEKGKAEIHILTGQNGTGKTTILQALASRHQNRFAFESVTNQYHKEQTIFHKKFKYLANLDSIKITYDTNTNNDVEITFDHLTYAFAYSGNRFIEHEENINIKEQEDYDPLENALAFDKEYGKDDYSINQWLANKMAERNSAFFKGKYEEANKYDEGIKKLREIIEAIVDFPIDFDYENRKVFAIKNNIQLDFDLLPDGLRSIISWLGDLIMRMDAIKWENDLDIKDREFILFLDEIEVHLHPYWQRKILPVIQKTFKNAQIFITTHSPFIVNSVDGAWIYELDLDEKTGNCKVTKVKESNTADSYQTVIREIFEVNRFSEPLVSELKSFTDMRNEILLKKQVDEKAFLEKATQLANKSDEIKNTILFELRQLSTKTGKEFVL